MSRRSTLAKVGDKKGELYWEMAAEHAHPKNHYWSIEHYKDRQDPDERHANFLRLGVLMCVSLLAGSYAIKGVVSTQNARRVVGPAPSGQATSNGLNNTSSASAPTPHFHDAYPPTSTYTVRCEYDYLTVTSDPATWPANYVVRGIEHDTRFSNMVIGNNRDHIKNTQPGIADKIEQRTLKPNTEVEVTYPCFMISYPYQMDGQQVRDITYQVYPGSDGQDHHDVTVTYKYDPTYGADTSAIGCMPLPECFNYVGEIPPTNVLIP